MNWDSLKVFLAIAETGSLSGAAKALGVNHSTVFRKLQALEADIGVRLLEKIENKYVLTRAGEEVLDEGQKISESFDAIDRRIMGADFQPRGTVKITAPFNIVNRYLPKLFAEFCCQYPDIEIEFFSSNQDFNLANRQADIAIRATSSPPEYLIGRKLCQIRWGVFGDKNYFKRHSQLDSLDDLISHRLIGASGAMGNLEGFVWLDNNYTENITIRCDELTAMSYMAEHGHGLAFLPVDQRREGIVQYLEFPPGKSSDLWLLTHPDLRKVERIRLVINYLSDRLTGMF